LAFSALNFLQRSFVTTQRICARAIGSELNAAKEHGWRKLEKTYGFFRTMWIWYKGDFRVRTQLSALAQPGTFHESAAHFPDVTMKRGDQQTSFEIVQKILEVKVALNSEQPWRLMMGKRPGLFFDDLSIDIGQPYLWLDLRAWIVFHPPELTSSRCFAFRLQADRQV
jgi:hypothetical protein